MDVDEWSDHCVKEWVGRVLARCVEGTRWRCDGSWSKEVEDEKDMAKHSNLEAPYCCRSSTSIHESATAAGSKHGITVKARLVLGAVMKVRCVGDVAEW